MARVTDGEAARQFSWIAPFLSVDNPASSALTRTRLAWEPRNPALLDDLKAADLIRHDRDSRR